MVGLSSVVVGVFCLSLFSRPVQAEVYVAGQFGASIPNSFSNLKSNTGQGLSNLNLQDSFAYGAKLGYYFDSMKWLGVETELFNSTPNVDQSGATSGRSLRVLNWSPITLVARLPLGFFQPYAGIGMGVYFADQTANGQSSSNTAVGLNTQLGLRFLLFKHLSLFGEWKYNYASFNFSGSAPTQATGGFEGNYSAHILAFGVGYHF
jgi:opacity protein-like surface antigen